MTVNDPLPSPVTRPPKRVVLELFAISALSLFVELALIRWLGSEVRIFAYFKNLVLIACFLGFGLGFFFSDRKLRLGTSLAVLAALICVVVIPARLEWVWGPQIASSALSNFQGSIFMGDRPGSESLSLLSVSIGLAWSLVLVLASLMVVFGFAQVIGRRLDAFGEQRRLTAYSWNVAGSLVGILGFSAASFFAISPFVWFGAVFLGTLPFFSRRAAALAIVPLLMISGALLYPDADVVWSPYQKLQFERLNQTVSRVLVNGTGYMNLHAIASGERRRVDRWMLPYVLKESPAKVLIIGAGAGNDASAALHGGAKEVVAVEIDPEIRRLGRQHHPDKPYSDPRVRVVVDDARHFVETTTEHFDLIVMSHLDSHTALSQHTNVRLDNYIYTVESLEACARLLKPNGMLYLSFWVTQPWVAQRLDRNLSLAFARQPASFFTLKPNGVVLAHFVATSDAEARERAARLPNNWTLPDSAETIPSTDDWPYLFVQNRQPPRPMLLLAIPLALLGAGLVVFALRRYGRDEDGRIWRLDRPFFFLGAGFLLVEVHNVSKLARVFGTTWVVNAWVISAILMTILIANWVAARWSRPRSQLTLYVPLGLLLIAGANLPIGELAATAGGKFLLAAIYTLPLFFAGLIFAHRFARTSHGSRSLGSNILGSILGGFLELASFWFGLSSLLYIALLLYALSYRADATRRLRY